MRCRSDPTCFLSHVVFTGYEPALASSSFVQASDIAIDNEVWQPDIIFSFATAPKTSETSSPLYPSASSNSLGRMIAPTPSPGTSRHTRNTS
jgi:hypothetical protein